MFVFIVKDTDCENCVYLMVYIDVENLVYLMLKQNRENCVYLKGEFAKNERGYRLNAMKKRF